MVLQG